MICVLQFTKVKMNISPGFNFSVCILRTSLCVMIRNNLYDVVSPKKKSTGVSDIKQNRQSARFCFFRSKKTTFCWAKYQINVDTHSDKGLRKNAVSKKLHIPQCQSILTHGHHKR